MNQRNRSRLRVIISSLIIWGAFCYPQQSLADERSSSIRIPKSDSLGRYVAPGTEASVVNLPAEITPETLGIKAKFDSSIEGLKRSEPNYFWQGDTYILRGDNLRDPEDASGQRRLSFFGIDNAKHWAYLSLVLSKSEFQAHIFNGRKYYLAKPISYQDANFSCTPWYHVYGLFGSTTKMDEAVRSGKWWFVCSASITLFLYEGQPLNYKN